MLGVKSVKTSVRVRVLSTTMSYILPLLVEGSFCQMSSTFTSSPEIITCCYCLFLSYTTEIKTNKQKQTFSFTAKKLKHF